MNSLLSEFEKTEVLEYPEVWFLGHESQKTKGEVGKPQNAGKCSKYRIAAVFNFVNLFLLTKMYNVVSDVVCIGTLIMIALSYNQRSL